MLQLDGAAGEGGGQILRTSLTLAMVTGTPFRIDRIRAGRARPGLMRQHLTAIQAAARLSRAEVQGAAIGATALSFAPGPVAAGEYHFAVGTAGSTSLVLQTVLPPLLVAGGRSTVTLEGGTHNPGAPPYDFLARAFLPQLCRLGPRVVAVLDRHGFYPAGGGRLTVAVEPAPLGRDFELLERGAPRGRWGQALLSHLPDSIGEREVSELARETGWDPGAFEVRQVDSPGPGNAVLLAVESEHVTEVFTGFGALGVRAEAVVAEAVRGLRRYLAAGAPVGEHLADQLLLPLAMAGGGRFRTLPLARHATTQIELIRRFLAVPIAVERLDAATCEVVVG